MPEAYLSRIARRAWPQARVTIKQVNGSWPVRTEFRLEGAGGAAFTLGTNFHDANDALLCEVRRVLGLRRSADTERPRGMTRH